MQLSKILRTCSQHFAQFVASISTFQFFETKMTIAAYMFSKSPTVKDTVTQMFK